MRLAWVTGEMFCGRSALIFLLMAGGATFAKAQETPKPQPAVPRTIILPQRVVAGASATLAVLDATGRLTPDVEVGLSTGQKITTDATGRALFLAPSDTGTLTAKISGQETAALTTVVATSSESLAPNPVEGSLNQSHYKFSYPHFLTLHDRFTIDGSVFNGRADSNHVFLAGQPCLIVASSPVSLVVLPGLHIPIGPIAIKISVDGHDLDLGSVPPVDAVLVEFSGPTEAANAGSQSNLVLHARGTKERLAVEVRNGSPEIIQLIHGNVQRVQTSGGEQNVALVDMKLLAAGNYLVTARLIPTESGLPDLEAVRQRLLEAHKVASGNLNSRIDRIIARIDQSPQDVTQIRAELKQILDEKPPGRVASLLDSAWQELNQR